MGYQSTLLGAVGSVGSGISIAALVHRQSPEYQAKVEKERLRVQADAEVKKREAELSTQKEYEKKVGKANEKIKTAKEDAEKISQDGGLDMNAVAASYDIQTKALSKIQKEAEKSYIKTGKSEYMDMRATARDEIKSLSKEKEKSLNQTAEKLTIEAQTSMNNAKEQKRKKKEMAK